MGAAPKLASPLAAIRAAKKRDSTKARLTLGNHGRATGGYLWPAGSRP